MTERQTIVWFRLDLRLSDNLALQYAASREGRVLPLFIWNPKAENSWAPGGASRWWLHQSLLQLDSELHKVGSQLIICRGDSLAMLRQVIRESGARCVVWNRRFDPRDSAQDIEIETELRQDGVEVLIFNSSLLHEPGSLLNQKGGPFRVFTPFWNRLCSSIEPPPPVEKPKILVFDHEEIETLSLDKLELQPKIDWAAGLSDTWTPGELGARARLKHFINHGIAHYAVGRDRPDQDGVSMLSPHLHFGEIGPRQIWHAVRVASSETGSKGAQTYLKEIGWREFAHHVLFHFPQTADQPLRAEFSRFPWSDDREALRRWQKGLTGYPIVDAGMRQLWQTGWMHNRVRMIVASFLTKDLLVSWHLGAKWFWDTLVDADLANNSLGWQWAAGCGADAAPYFRVFNPVLQGEKFDPLGDYVRSWIPELSDVPVQWIHQPWNAPSAVLRVANVELGTNYPAPIVDHSIARKRALDALSQIEKQKAPAGS